ncbi:hypothetical protein C0J52_03293 [Blattella germanica]|nr:hypothetical protein C0J52_03293 [Blattella germanica]
MIITLCSNGLHRLSQNENISDKNFAPNKKNEFGSLLQRKFILDRPSHMESWQRWQRAQAVGNAMASNPLQIIVPCHRVIRSGGLLGQYSRGTKNTVKLWLLEHEGLKIVENKIISI